MHPINLMKEQLEFHGLPYCEKKLEKIYELTQTDPSYVLLHNDDGYLLGLVAESFFSNQKNAIELGFYSKNGKGKELIKLFEEWARSKGADSVVMSSRSDMTEYYKRKDYRLTEYSYQKELN